MRIFALVPLIALTSVGCGLFSIEPEEIDIADGDEIGAEGVGDTTGDATGDEAGTGGESSTDGSDTTNPTTGADSSTDSATDTSGDSSSDTSDSGTGTDTGGACELLGDDPVCLACVKDSCCDELLACELDTDCGCLLGCIDNGGSLEACLTECPALGDPFAALASCTEASCASECS